MDLYSRQLQVRHQVTGPQLTCLLAISDSGETTPSALSREVHLSPSTVIEILDRLESRGLVTRRRAAKDRRVVQLALTEAGRSLVAAAPSPLQDTLAGKLNELDELELATIADSLDRIVALMEVRHLDAAPILTTGPIPQPAATWSSEALEPSGSGLTKRDDTKTTGRRPREEP